MHNHIVFSLGKSGSNGLALDIANENPQCAMLHSYFSKRWHINNDWDRLTVDYDENDDFGWGEHTLTAKEIQYYDNQTAIKLDALKQFSNNNNFVLFCSVNYIDLHILHFLQKDPRTKIYLIERNIADVFISLYINNFTQWSLTRPTKGIDSRKKVLDKNSVTVEKFFFNDFTIRYKKYIKFRNRISFAKIIQYEDYNFKSSDYYHAWNTNNKFDYIENKKEVVEFLIQLVSIRQKHRG
tara:strand:+ start:673 stop:1389 length:717 start_codon:yes stop_codon:yes gene_type:complete